MSIQLLFRISIRSDYHISAGHGLGALIDSALQRDADGLPVLRGTTLAGLLREGLRDLGSASPMRTSNEWQRMVKVAEGLVSDERRGWEASDALFGAPSHPKRWQISSGRPTNLIQPQDVGDSGWRPGGLGGRAAAHVRVHPALRRAEARKLFVREEGDQRLTFDFTATCSATDEKGVAEALLLVAAARMVRHLGAGRRRGRGECSIHLARVTGWPVKQGDVQPDEKALLTLFEESWLANRPMVGVKSLKAIEVPSVQRSGQPLRLVMVVRTDEPVLIAQRAEAGNQFDGLSFIPGFVLRGALAGLVTARHDLNDPALHQVFTRLFFRDGVRCSPLLPAFEVRGAGGNLDLYPTIPAPQDLFVSELHPGTKKLIAGYTVYEAHTAAQKDFKDTDGGRDLKLEPLSGWLAVREEAEVVKADRSSEMHVTMNPDTGRAKDQDLFGYVTIASGQYFLGEMVFQDSSDWATLQELVGLPTIEPPDMESEDVVGPPGATFELRVGKAIRRGYGRISCALFQVSDPNHNLWAGLPIESRITAVEQPLTLTLISDAIVPDPWGRSYQNFDAQWLSERLGVKVQLASETGTSGIDHTLQFAHGKVIDTFNNYIGLPRHRDLALMAGSAVTLLVDEVISLDDLHERLQKVETQGIGLRRNEGFGRVVFNHPIYQNACQSVADTTGIKAPSALRRGKAFAETELVKESNFGDTWKEILAPQDSKWSKLKHEEFDGLGREIRTARLQSLDDARALLANYGKAATVMPGGLPGRQKPSFFEAEGKDGLALLSSLFERLNGLAGGSVEKWTIGCAMMAEQMALVVPERKEK